MVQINLDLDGSDYIAISHFTKLAFLMSSDFVISKSLSPMPLHIAIRKTPMWSLINGSSLILAQWLRLNRNITFCNFGFLVIK
jgi:hypothetical protein